MIVVLSIQLNSLNAVFLCEADDLLEEGSKVPFFTVLLLDCHWLDPPLSGGGEGDEEAANHIGWALFDEVESDGGWSDILFWLMLGSAFLHEVGDGIFDQRLVQLQVLGFPSHWELELDQGIDVLILSPHDCKRLIFHPI